MDIDTNIDGVNNAEDEEDIIGEGDATIGGVIPDEPDEEGYGGREEAEGDEGEDEEAIHGDPERQLLGRAGNRIHRLLEDTRSYKEQLQATRAEVEGLKSHLAQVANSRTEEQLQYMDPEQRRAYEDQRWRSNIEQAVQYQRLLAEDSADRADFRDLVLKSPTAAKFASKVEEEVAKLKSQGVQIQRKHVYYHLLGQEVDSKTSRSVTKARKSGETNVKRQSVRPSNSKSNVRAAESGSVSSWRDFEAKFGNTPIRGGF